MKFKGIISLTSKERTAKSAYQFDKELGFWGVPGFNKKVITVETKFGGDKIDVFLNSDGNRDKEVGKIDEEGSVVIIGGSHTWGVGIEYGNRFSEIVSDRIDKPVINMGKASFGIDQICMTIMGRMKKYNPKIIIIEQYPTAILRILNHNMGHYVKPYFKLDSNKNLKLVKTPKIVRYKNFRMIHSAILSYKKELKEFRSGINIIDDYNLMKDPIFYLWKTSHYDYMYRLLDSILLVLKSYCDENHIKLLFVLGTNHQQFIETEKSELVDYNLPKTKIKSILDCHDINYTDSKEELLKAHSKNNTVIFDDGHLNNKGNQVFASVILSKLNKLNWL